MQFSIIVLCLFEDVYLYLLEHSCVTNSVCQQRNLAIWVFSNLAAIWHKVYFKKCSCCAYQGASIVFQKKAACSAVTVLVSNSNTMALKIPLKSNVCDKLLKLC